MNTDRAEPGDSTRGTLAARAGVVLVAVIWGLNWVSVRFALRELSPWAFRTISLSCGALILIAMAKWRGISLSVKKGPPRLHLAVAGLLNVGGYGILSAFAQLSTATSRTAICASTMPIWATLLARPVLGERLDRWRGSALVIGGCGLLVLLWPALAVGLPVGSLLALGSAISWAVGTVYLKWARVEASPIAVTAWQLVAGASAVMIGLLASGTAAPASLGRFAVGGLIYTTLFGTALAYLLWFRTSVRLPASTAGLGILLVPVVGVGASVALLGDRPSAADLGGFALIFIAAVCALGPRTGEGDSTRCTSK
jgi:drug/metabolite transporter (DMT)-like permease